MRLSLSIVDATLLGTFHSEGGVQRHRMAFARQEILSLTREILGVLEEGVRRDQRSAALEPALKLLGGRLGTLLFPPALQDVLAGAEGALVLELDPELSFIPWELVVVRERFLCMHFDLARVMVKEEDSDRKAALGGRARGLIIVSDPDGNLPGAMAEGEVVLETMESSMGIPVRLVVNPGREEVMQLLGTHSFVHYIGHAVGGAQGQEVAWKLRDGLLGAEDLRALGRAVVLPYLVFSSACPGLPGLEVPWTGQISAAFLQGGTRHFLGTHWDLPDGQGAGFASDFYHLLGKGTLGSALRGARRGCKPKDDAVLWSLFFHIGEPDFRLARESKGDEPTRLGPRGDVPWKKPRMTPRQALSTPAPRRRHRRRLIRFSGVVLIILSVAVPAIYLTQKALRRRERIEVVIGPNHVLEGTARTLAFKGFSTSQKGLDAAIMRMERCFIRHMTYLRGLDVIDGREGALPADVQLELSGKIISDREGPKVLLVVHRRRDKSILYIDEFPLFAAGEEQCIKLSEWVKRTLEL